MHVSVTGQTKDSQVLEGFFVFPILKSHLNLGCLFCMSGVLVHIFIHASVCKCVLLHDCCFCVLSCVFL